ncbi:MAG: hypothetical protein ACRC7O_04410, partial [Fimbriiglobus sp.]
MSELVPAPADALLKRQQAFLLHQLATAPDGTLTQSEANKAIPKQIKDELNFTNKSANDIRWKMVVAGLLNEQKVKRTVTYTITDAGRENARELEPIRPLLPAKGTAVPPVDDRVRVAREVYVLAAISRADGKTLTRAATAAVAKQACLQITNLATVRAVLSDLALRGEVEVHRDADAESYALTPAGVALLERLRPACPVLPPTGKPTAPSDEAVRQGREAFVL